MTRRLHAAVEQAHDAVGERELAAVVGDHEHGRAALADRFAQHRRARSPADAASSEAVGSSARMSSGSLISARATATHWRWPVDSAAGRLSMRAPSPTRRSHSSGRSRVIARAVALALQLHREAQRLARRERVEQMVVLEDEADLAAQRGEPRFGRAIEIAAEHFDRAFLVAPKPADQRHQRGLARTGGAAKDHELARREREIDAIEHRRDSRIGVVAMRHAAQRGARRAARERDRRVGSSEELRRRRAHRFQRGERAGQRARGETGRRDRRAARRGRAR